VADSAAGPAPLGISADLWEILACPCPAHAPVTADLAAARIVCTSCGRSFEVRDGIPVMLLDEAILPGAAGAAELTDGG
jgi:uncharacterized protein YbaR (Trm112 family)